MHQRRVLDLLGAHVSTQGGVHNALARGKAIGASAIQVFTKTPNQWREPALSEEVRTAFRRECDRSGIARIVAHDSYLINLATPDPVLAARSIDSFTQELRRCDLLGIPAVVSHPGNFIDDRDAGIDAQCHRRHPLPPVGPRRGDGAAGDHRGLGHLAGRHLRGAGRAPGGGATRASATASPSAWTPAISTAGGLRSGGRLRRRVASLEAGHRLRAAPLHSPQRLQDALRLAARPPRADRRRAPRPGALPADHARRRASAR